MSSTCDRCLKECGEQWWDRCAIGVIKLECASQSFAKLGGVTRGCADKEHFELWNEGHPALSKFEAQHVQFEWSPNGKYRLCEECHNTLISVIGEFFGMHRRVLQLKISLPPSQQHCETRHE